MPTLDPRVFQWLSERQKPTPLTDAAPEAPPAPPVVPETSPVAPPSPIAPPAAQEPAISLPQYPEGLDLGGLRAAQAADLARNRGMALGRAGERALSLMTSRPADYTGLTPDQQNVRNWVEQRKLAGDERERKLKEGLLPLDVRERVAGVTSKEAKAGEDVASSKKTLADLAEVEKSRAAMNDPDSMESGIARDLARQYAPELNIPDGVPGARILQLYPMLKDQYEAQLKAKLFGISHGKFQWHTDPLTLRTYRSDPITGAEWWENGSVKTAPIRPGPQIPGLPTPPADGTTPPTPAPKIKPSPKEAQTPAGPDKTAPTGGPIGPPEPLPAAGPLAKAYETSMTAFKKDMDAAAASSRSAFGSSANIIFRGARVLPLLKQVDPKTGQPRQLTTQEWQDVNAALLSMQTGGVPAQQMMNEGLPTDIQGNAAKLMSWLTSKPHEPDRQEWIDRFLNNLKREEEAAKTFQRETRLERLASYSQEFGRYPNRFKIAAKPYGIDPSLIDQVASGTYDADAEKAKGPGGAGGGEQPPIPGAIRTKSGKWAKKNAQGQWEYL